MSMRLLPKSAVDKAKQLDRQREIDEGAKLASRVDNLRELVALEEANLTEFRKKSVKATKEAIDPLLVEKEALLSDILDLTEERKRLSVPLDAEWVSVNKARAKCNDWEEDLDKRTTQVKEKTQELDILRTELETEKERIANERERSRGLVASSGRMYAEAEETLSDARNKSEVIISEAELRSQQTLRKEEKVLADERSVKMLRDDTFKKLRDLENRERALKDKMETLERTVKRLKKQYGNKLNI